MRSRLWPGHHERRNRILQGDSVVRAAESDPGIGEHFCRRESFPHEKRILAQRWIHSCQGDKCRQLVGAVSEKARSACRAGTLLSSFPFCCTTNR